MSSKIEFTKENIDLYFTELSKEYKRLGGRKMPIEIVLIGGAAITISYGFRNMTTDIDAIMPAIGIMKEAINNISDKNNLPNGWINTDFMQTSSYSPNLINYSKPYKLFNQVLSVRIILGEYLVAMKLKSARQYKNDFSDIIGILLEHERNNNPISYESIIKAIIDLYGNIHQIDNNAISFIKNVIDNGNYEQIYETIRKNEIDTKSALIEFVENEPGILKQENVDKLIDDFGMDSVDKSKIKIILLDRTNTQKK